ncbi:uncharacterized protein LOC112047643 isoform X1 [Bicyclus anynana]|uniref:Uncharacterized protein LOC112047643 isoform X1 n=1 Tax=Bicyclus anynana TaxID=110368 RepID=A0ABM3M530_BICAN|nr:uncharacterized protein LOC112047643 isoform X1 [Bicyclus anynana]
MCDWTYFIILGTNCFSETSGSANLHYFCLVFVQVSAFFHALERSHLSLEMDPCRFWCTSAPATEGCAWARSCRARPCSRRRCAWSTRCCPPTTRAPSTWSPAPPTGTRGAAFACRSPRSLYPNYSVQCVVLQYSVPTVSNTTGERAYMIQKSPAVLLLARKVPDLLAEIPLRPVEVDYRGEEALSLHEECLMAGWHFFYKGDKIYPVHKFLLQRNVRVQFLIIVKKSLWCDTISLKFQNAMTNLGYTGDFDRSVSICVRDGMYGAPLVCKGKLVALLMAPDAQWTNCTGHSNLVQVLSSPHVRSFMNCVSRLVDMSQCMYGVLRALCARASWSHC